MSGTIEGIKAVNSVMRTLLVLAAAGVVGYGGYLGYYQFVVPAGEAREAKARLEEFRLQNVELQKTVAAQSEKLDELQRLNDKLQTSLKLIKLDRRVAAIKVVRKGKDDAGQPWMDIEFVEMDREGKQPTGKPRPYRLKGERLYVDCWLVKFEDRYVEDADLLRNATLCVFKEIYGDLDGPSAAQSLDKASGEQIVPAGYDDSDVNAFERKIWYDFWSVANSAARQRELGIRAAHGQANNILAEEGQTYIVELRASDGVTLRPASGETLEQRP